MVPPTHALTGWPPGSATAKYPSVTGGTTAGPCGVEGEAEASSSSPGAAEKSCRQTTVSSEPDHLMLRRGYPGGGVLTGATHIAPPPLTTPRERHGGEGGKQGAERGAPSSLT